MARTKMIWEMEAGEIGTLRDKDRTVVFAVEAQSKPPTEIIAMTRKPVYSHAYELKISLAANGFKHLEYDGRVDLLDVKLPG